LLKASQLQSPLILVFSHNNGRRLRNKFFGHCPVERNPEISNILFLPLTAEGLPISFFLSSATPANRRADPHFGTNLHDLTIVSITMSSHSVQPNQHF